MCCFSGHYCPPGSIGPRPCSALASCPAGSDRYMHWGCLVLLALLPMLFFGDSIARWVRSRLRSSHAAHADTRKSVEGSGEQPAAPLPSASVSVPQLQLTFDRLQASVRVSGVDRPILSDVSGRFAAGRLIAVMGPSGAGKVSSSSVQCRL